MMEGRTEDIYWVMYDRYLVSSALLSFLTLPFCFIVYLYVSIIQVL